MKFLIIAPLLLAPVFGQFGFIGDVANTIKNTAEDGVKAVERVAVDGAHEVKNVGEQIFHEAENVVGTIGEVGQSIGSSIEQAFNPQQP